MSLNRNRKKVTQKGHMFGKFLPGEIEHEMMAMMVKATREVLLLLTLAAILKHLKTWVLRHNDVIVGWRHTPQHSPGRMAIKLFFPVRRHKKEVVFATKMRVNWSLACHPLASLLCEKMATYCYCNMVLPLCVKKLPKPNVWIYRSVLVTSALSLSMD